MEETGGTSKSFRDVIAWQKAHQFVLMVYRLTESFPKHELFGLTSQLRRAAVSIAANIAEGFAREGHADKLRFYNIALASLEECDYYLILCRDLGYAQPDEAAGALLHARRTLRRYAAGLRSRG